MTCRQRAQRPERRSNLSSRLHGNCLPRAPTANKSKSAAGSNGTRPDQRPCRDNRRPSFRWFSSYNLMRLGNHEPVARARATSITPLLALRARVVSEMPKGSCLRDRQIHAYAAHETRAAAIHRRGMKTVCRVFAPPSWREALYGLGYMHAIDRPTQLLFARTMAAGRSAELISDRRKLVETDRFFRRAGLALRLDEEVRTLDDETFAELTFYCEGVNDGLKESGRTLPMWAARYHPSPWNHQAVLLVGNLLNYGGLAIGQQKNERLLLELIQAGIDAALLQELFAPMLDDADFALLRRVKISSQLSDEALDLITDLPRLAGSNAWAVAPHRSATGSALLAADPHLEINRLPPIWYEAVLQWGDHYAPARRCPVARCWRSPAPSGWPGASPI